jgi:ribonuclease T2
MLYLVLRLAANAVFSLLLTIATAGAQDTRQNEPGSFDFYVLALSWSPSFCETVRDAAREPQCERTYAFVVHGLWPQYDKGFPEYCQQPAPKLDRGIVAGAIDVMPAPRLIFREWDRHGTCSGLSARAYFETIRKARAAVKIPAEYMDVKEALTVTPDQVEDAFVKANPGLARDGVSINCDRTRLREVRVCLTRDLHFRSCGELDQRTCRAEKLVMPPRREQRAARETAQD